MAITLAQVRENKLVRRLTLAGSVCAALMAIYNFGDMWDKIGLPRPVFMHEYTLTVNRISQEMRTLEIDYRKRAIMYDQKNLREIDKEIADRQSKGQPPSTNLQDARLMIQDSLDNHRARLKILEDNKID